MWRFVGAPVKAATLRRFHAFATVFWLFMSIPSILFWRNSVPFLVGVSVYALAVSHWSGWQGARAEQMSEDTSNTCP